MFVNDYKAGILNLNVKYLYGGKPLTSTAVVISS